MNARRRSLVPEQLETRLPLAAPVANDDIYFVEQDVDRHISADLGVLKNDTDEDNDGLTVSLVEDVPFPHQLNLSEDGSISFYPASDFVGTVEFRYRVSDGTNISNAATVELQVHRVLSTLVAVEDEFDLHGNEALHVHYAYGVLANDQPFEDTGFSTPMNMGSPINGPFTDKMGSFSEDGLTFAYSTDRPGGAGDQDIWVATRNTIYEPLGEPIPLTVINSSAVESNPRFSVDGLTLYFNSYRTGVGDVREIKRATLDSPFDPETINVIFTTPTNESTSSFDITRDGLTMYASAEGNGGFGIFDIFRSDRSSVDEDFGSITNLGQPFNTEFYETSPTLSTDGLTIYFASSRPGGQGPRSIMQAQRPTMDDPFGVPEFVTAVNEDYEGTVDVSPDNKTLIFSSRRSGTFGREDLWVSYRAPQTHTAVLFEDVSHGELTLEADGGFSYVPAAGFAGTDTFTYRLDRNGISSWPTTVTIYTFDRSVPLQVTSLAHNIGEQDPVDLPIGPQPAGWLSQQSDLQSVTVQFNKPIAAQAADFVLTNLGVNAPLTADQVVPIQDHQVSVTANELTIAWEHGSDEDLIDGVYHLELLPSITDLMGNALDGNQDGEAGDSFHYRGDPLNKFYQLSGDWNGDQAVSVFDVPPLAYWFGSQLPVAPSYMDCSIDGGVSIFDFSCLAGNFGSVIVFPNQQDELEKRSHELQKPPLQELVDLVMIERLDRMQDDILNAQPIRKRAFAAVD